MLLALNEITLMQFTAILYCLFMDKYASIVNISTVLGPIHAILVDLIGCLDHIHMYMLYIY